MVRNVETRYPSKAHKTCRVESSPLPYSKINNKIFFFTKTKKKKSHQSLKIV